MHAIMFAVALLHVQPTVKPSNTVTVAPVVITATWTCGAPRGLATDATATVRDCKYVVR